MPTEVAADVVRPAIKIGGADLDDELEGHVGEIEVENSLHLPDVATIRFQLSDVGYDDTHSIPDDKFKNYLSQGQELEVYVEQGSENYKLFNGEITSVSLEHSALQELGPMFAVVQAFDRSHRLHRGRRTRTFQNMKISDIVAKIAQAHNLTPKVDETSGVRDYVLQANQTDWEFLRQLASRAGYELWTRDKELHFEAPQKSPGQPVPLTWGDDLAQFRMRATTAAQVSEVTVRGWDWEQQQPIVARASSGEGAPELGEGRSGVDQANAAYGDTMVEIVDVPVEEQGQADGIAQALADEIASGHIYAVGGTAGGRGEILPGKLLELNAVGNRFGGAYYVTATTHRYSQWEGYTTTFEVGGHRSHSLGEALAPAGETSRSNHHIPGVVIGVVTNVEDEADLGRIKVQFPWLHDSDTDSPVETFWARIATPDAGPERGFQWLPEINDEVLVAFEYGDPHRPFIIGGLWNGQSKPPKKNSEAFESGVVNKRILKSRTGHVFLMDDTDGAELVLLQTQAGNLIKLDDTDDKEMILLQTQAGHVVRMDDTDGQGMILLQTLAGHLINLDDTDGSESIVIRDKTGSNEIVIDSNENSLSIKVDGDISIEAGGKIDVTGAQAISITSSGDDVSIDCNNFTVNAKQNADITATAGMSLETNGSASLKATAGLDLETTAQANIKGTAGLNLETPAVANVSAMIVNLG